MASRSASGAMSRPAVSSSGSEESACGVVAEDEEVGVSAQLGDLEQCANRALDAGESSDPPGVLRGDGAEGEVGGAVLGDEEVGAAGTDEAGRRRP